MTESSAHVGRGTQGQQVSATRVTPDVGGHHPKVLGLADHANEVARRAEDLPGPMDGICWSGNRARWGGGRDGGGARSASPRHVIGFRYRTMNSPSLPLVTMTVPLGKYGKLLHDPSILTLSSYGMVSM